MYTAVLKALSRFVNSDEYGTVWGYPKQLFLLVAAVLAVYGVLLVLLVLHVVRPPPKRKTTLLLGATGAGKTTIFRQLREGAFFETEPSHEEFGAKFPMQPKYNTLKSKPFVTVFDFPGHVRLRSRVPSHYATAGIIAFVVDAADPSSFRKSAQFLLDIFANPTVHEVSPVMAIACNKTDLSTAASVDTVRAELEKELTVLKEKTSKASDRVAVGRDGVAFDFGVDAPCPVTFVSCSAKESELSELSTFILKNY